MSESKGHHKNDWAAAAAKVALRMIGTGNVIWMCLTLIILVAMWRLSSPDLRAVMEKILGWPWFGATGWLLFVLTLFGCRWALKRQGEEHEKEIERMAKVRNVAMQSALALPLASSKKE